MRQIKKQSIMHNIFRPQGKACQFHENNNGTSHQGKTKKKKEPNHTKQEGAYNAYTLNAPPCRYSWSWRSLEHPYTKVPL